MNQNFNKEDRMYNSSCISDYMQCPRNFYYKYMRRLEDREPKTSMAFGSMFHAAKALWRGGRLVEECLPAFEGLPSGITPDHRTRGWGESIFKEYCEKYKVEPFKVLHTEKSGRIEIGDRLYGFTLDDIIDWDGSIYAFDTKTTGSIGKSFFERYRPHPQVDGYSYACREMMGKCSGAWMDGISTAKNPRDRFLRAPSSRTDKEMDQWAVDFTDWTDKIERDIDSGRFARNTANCHMWGKCMFWEQCVYGEDEKALDMKFKVAE